MSRREGGRVGEDTCCDQASCVEVGLRKQLGTLFRPWTLRRQRGNYGCKRFSHPAGCRHLLDVIGRCGCIARDADRLSRAGLLRVLRDLAGGLARRDVPNPDDCRP